MKLQSKGLVLGQGDNAARLAAAGARRLHISVHTHVEARYEALVVGRPELQRRFVEVVAGNREAAATLRAHARPTALGAALLAEIDRWDGHYEGV